MIKCRYFFLLCIFIVLFSKNEVKAGTYDNAYTFYTKYASEGNVAQLNKNDGYMYICSWGNKSVSGTKYKTVGYTISINIDGNKDSVEVKLDGTLIKEVSTVTHDNIVYVLRKARLSRIQELFNGNTDISWYQIFRNKNTFEFDAIMTVVENGVDLCGNVYESSNFRSISADNNTYLYRKLSGIKGSRNWSNPSDLNNFYNRIVDVVSVSPLKPGSVSVSGENVFKYNNVYYVKNNSVIDMAMESLFDDAEAASARYHPNFNVFRVSGWGDDQKYCMMQGKNNSEGKASLFADGKTNDKPLALRTINKNNTSSSKESYLYFISSAKFTMKVPDGEKIQIIPEGRVYYNSLYPDEEKNIDNLCDIQSDSSGKATIISDGQVPLIEVPKYISGFDNADVRAVGYVTDNGSGINTVRLYRSDGIIMYEKTFDVYCREYSISNDCTLVANRDYTYYIYAKDNVGNEMVSDHYYINTFRTHNVQAAISKGINGYNGGNIDVHVFGGSSEISALLIMSEDYNNPLNDRVIIANKSVETHTLPAGMYQYNYNVDAMEILKDMPDGEYVFDVISGGRYVSSEPKTLVLRKDKTLPEIRWEEPKTSCGWYKNNAEITVDVCDNYSGIDTFETECNGEVIDGPVTYDNYFDRYLKKLNITEDGENNVVCVATDMAGNVFSDSLRVKIDANPPFCTLYGGFTGTDKNRDKWINRKQFAASFVLHDFQSGMLVNKSDIPLMVYQNGKWVELNRDYYTLYQEDYDNAHFLFSTSYRDSITSSKNIYKINVKDRVGNLLTNVFYVNVDCDAPTLSYPESGAWDKEKLKGNIIVKDAHSGLASVRIKCNDSIIKNLQYENVQSAVVELDLTEYKRILNKLSIETEDAVGNVAEYMLDFKLPVNIKIRTRIR